MGRKEDKQLARKLSQLLERPITVDEAQLLTQPPPLSADHPAVSEALGWRGRRSKRFNPLAYCKPQELVEMLSVDLLAGMSGSGEAKE